MTKHLNKRIISALALGGLAIGLAFAPAHAAENKPAPAKAGTAQTYDGYKDIVLGNKNAPITVIEYASMTCSHCAEFQKNVFPEFKKNYVDTGKAKYIMRHFVLNAPDLFASMIARCTPENRYYPMLDALLVRQADWMKGWENVRNAPENASNYDLVKAAGMDKFVRPMGFTDARLKACLASDKLRDDLFKLRQEGSQKYNITGTPTILINGEKYTGDHSFEALDKALKAVK